MRIQAPGRLFGRLAKLAMAPAAVLLLAACGDQANENPTSDAAAPGLIGETSNGIGFPHEVVTTQGIESASLYLPIFLIAVVIFILVEGLLLFMAFRFRRRKSDTDLPSQTHGNNTLEILWTAIPALVVTVLFVASMMVLNNVQAQSDDPAVTVETTASQFQWEFAYPDYGFTKSIELVDGEVVQPDMVVPVDQRIHITVTSTDVIHSFYVPAFFYKMDAIPGRTNSFDLNIEEVGRYGGQCAEFCGTQHGDMFLAVEVLPREEFDAWVEAEIAALDATPAPESSPEPGATEAPVGTLLEIATVQEKPLAFTEDTLTAQAGETVTVAYLNDSNLAHNIAFYEGSDSKAPLIANTEIVTGPDALETVTFESPSTAGAYFFMCQIHPIQMTGTFEVVA